MSISYTPETLTSGYASVDFLNNEFAKIQTALADGISRSGSTPNTMSDNIDLNSNKLLNVSDGTLGTDGVNLSQVRTLAQSIAETVLSGGASSSTTTGDPITLNYGLVVGSQGTSSNTVFDLESLLGVSSLIGLTVVVNGVVQFPGLAYGLSGLVVTFLESLNADDDIMFIYGDLSPVPTQPLYVNNYDIATYQAATPDAAQVCLRIVADRDIIFQDDFAGSYLNAGTAATGSSVFTVKVDGSSIGTITVSASGTTGTFATTGSGEETVSAGSVLSIECPSPADATLADISITLYGSRG